MYIITHVVFMFLSLLWDYFPPPPIFSNSTYKSMVSQNISFPILSAGIMMVSEDSKVGQQ